MPKLQDVDPVFCDIWPRGYKTFLMLNSAEHEIVLLINLKLLTIANSFLLNIAEHKKFSANKYENANYFGIFIFISRENFMLDLVEHEKSFIPSRPDLGLCSFVCRVCR